MLYRAAVGFIAAVALLAAAAGSASAYTVNPITPAAGWSTPGGFGASSLGWYQDAFGIVHLQGSVANPSPSASGLLGILPPQARPSRSVFEIVHTFLGSWADLSIDSQGRIGLIPARSPEVTDARFVSLENVSYQPGFEYIANPISTTTNWTGAPELPNSFGASEPGWYRDGSGNVHLQGGLALTNPFGSNPSLIGTLPPQARPAREISTIVHTFNGTRATLFLSPDGGISVFAPPSPVASGLQQFVSLEGVTFQTGTFANSIALNSNNWTSVAPHTPGWYGDGAGIIHLQGEVNMTSNNGPDPSAIGTLPPQARPDRNVFLVTKTGVGHQQEDLVIGPDGVISVLAPQIVFPDPVPTLLSLDNISYQPNSATGPHALSLTANGDVLAVLHKPRHLGLAVFKLGPHAHQLGTVKLGLAPAGRSRFHWNLSVDGHRLSDGTYIAELLAIPARGEAIAGGPGVTFTLAGKGRLRVLSSTCSVAQALSHHC